MRSASVSRCEMASGVDGAIAGQLGRLPRGEIGVECWCEKGMPSVIKTSATVEDGSPFPTLFYLTCPLLRRLLARLEDEGLIGRLSKRIASEPELRRELADATEAYVRERGSADGGIGGSASLEGVKCLHAHYAHYLARGINPVGRLTAEALEKDWGNERHCESCRV